MRLALGTVQFGLPYGVANTGGRVSPELVSVILDHAQARGIDTLDTAIAYGESEAVLGKVGVRSWNTITKLPGVPGDCIDVGQWVRDQVHQSIERLGVSQLHGVLLHRPEQLLGEMGGALNDAMQSLKAQGMTRKIGVSVYTPQELARLAKLNVFDIVQAPLNILDRRLVDSGWVARLRREGTEIHIRSVFLQGLLLMPSHQRPVQFNHWQTVWMAWDRWLAREGLSPLEACLGYINRQRDIDRVIVGVDTLAHLEQILEAAGTTLNSLPEFPRLEDDSLLNPASWTQL